MRHRLVTGLLVIGGLVACGLAALPSSGSSESLPSVALGSELVLAVERAVTLFAAWMLALVVVARALTGELPLEISGRGFRYAERDVTRSSTARLERVLELLQSDMDEMRDEIVGEQERSGA